MNKRRAYLYVRVSTDEQAEKYSPKHQYDRLTQYCQYENIEIVDIYTEDYSAKTFDRPEFNKLLARLKKQRNSAELLLFLKWDRFSRNVAEAYTMISRLQKFGIEPQSIEQPLNFEIPESKIMLAIYLAAPEVENDRRSLNVIAGMRRAMREGRCVNKAPRGYCNTIDLDKNPIIAPSKDSEIIKWCFEEMNKDKWHIRDIWRMARQKGLKAGKSAVWNMLRNPIYCGRIFIPAYKDEPATTVKGMHEPIISEELFDDVQDLLNGRKKRRPVKHAPKDELPLRGYLQCAKCGSKLTGSASKGNGGRYFYYHCVNGCHERFKAETANEEFRKELCKVSSNRNATELFQLILRDYAQLSDKDRTRIIVPLKSEVEKSNSRISNARQLMLDGELDPKDYREIKDEYEGKIKKLEAKIQQMTFISSHLGEQLTFCGQLLPNVAKYYATADLSVKQQIIGSIYPEKLIFEKNSYRTMRVNDVVRWICRPVKDFSESENKDSSENSELSTLVAPPGFEPRQTVPKTVVLPLYYRAPYNWMAKLVIFPNPQKKLLKN